MVQPLRSTLSPTRLSGVAASTSADVLARDFGSFYRENFRAVARGLRQLAGDAAEDIAQEAFVAVLLRWEEVGHLDAPDAWTWVVARRLAMRRASRESARPAKESLATLRRRVDDGPSDPDLSRALEDLPARQHSAVILHYVLGLPLSEVADLLGCGESAAKVLLYRARGRLAQMVGGYEGRWVSESRWSTDAVVRLARDLGAREHEEILAEEVPGRGARRELTFDKGTYLLVTDDGERLDHGRFCIGDGCLVLDPAPVPGTIRVRPRIDGDRVTFRQVEDTTPAWRGVPDWIYIRLLLESGGFLWAGASRLRGPGQRSLRSSP